MSNKPDRTPPSIQLAAVSLVAAVACVLAGSAHASRRPASASLDDHELSARVAAIAARVRADETRLLPHLPPEPKMAWRN